MKAASVPSFGIVPEVLNSGNYDIWSVFMKDYLMGEGLWQDVFWSRDRGGHDIEQGLSSEYNIKRREYAYSYMRKDAKTLHIIRISCERHIQNELLHFVDTKSAWYYLENRYGGISSEVFSSRQVASDPDDSFTQQSKELFSKVTRGDYIEDIIDSSNLDITSSDKGRTLLHVAVIAGNVDNVKMLITKGSEGLLLRQDNDGNTALFLVARYTGNTDMAKCMVETNNGSGEQLLEMQNNENIIPILMAAAKGHKELTTYLYSQTTYKSKLFDETDSQYLILLLSLCITAEIFDVALKLLKRYQNLPKESLSLYNFSVPELLRESLSLPKKNYEHDLFAQRPIPDQFSALVALAKMPSAFPSGNHFSHREQFIYDILSVENEFRGNYPIPDIANVVHKVTHTTVDDNERPLKTSSVGRFGFGSRILNYLLLVMHYGWLFCKLLVLIFLLWPIKLLGLVLHRIFYGIAYLFIQSFKFLNIFGVRRIYDMKYTHYEVIGILNYFCQSIRGFNDLQLKEASAYEAMLHGAQHGIIEFINLMREAKPELLSVVDTCHRDIFSYAILHRKQNVFQLIYCLRGPEKFRSRIDTFGNNLLHLAAQLGPSSDRDTRSGAALQMQREIQWFKAVEDLMHPRIKEARNIDGKKPYDLFIENHVELVKDGEKWTKDTAKSYITVASLILTITFAAAFTVPGGNNQETGTPIFLHEKIFNMFIIADAVSIFISASSVLVFIGILTSRYAGRDFLKVLPLKLVLALVLLLLSVCSMMVAFYAALNVILKGNHTGGSRWFVLGPILALGSVPVFILLVSQLSFIYKILHSTIRNPISSLKKG